MSNVVFDASAILAVIGREPGAEVVATHLPGALVSTVNLAEVLSKSRDMQLTLEAVKWIIAGLRMETVLFDEELAFVAGSLREPTRSAGLSLGDRACLALGVLRKLPVVTAEKNWRSLSLGVEIVQIR